MSILSTFPSATRFIETGTAQGETLVLASKFYLECLSIEVDYQKYLTATHKFNNIPNIRLYYGHSPYLLKHLVDPLVSTVFWLDAHYVDAEIGKIKGYGNCPLLGELKEIISCPWEISPTVLIDDFDTFKRGLYSWPTVAEIDTVMTGWNRAQVTDDVFSYVKC